jgi:galactose-1-phosphate uridylyltransferase
MGAGSSLRQRKKTITEVTAFTETDIEDDLDNIDWSVGFNKKAAAQYGWGGLSTGEVRTETDEFRVLRVSSLSDHVTLYVAGGKHKKPTQYSSARACPRAAEQPCLTEKCPFCPGNESNTPPSILSYDQDGEEQSLSTPPAHLRWQVRVFPNIFPMLICPLPFYGERHREALQSIPHSVVAQGLHANHKVSVDANCAALLQVDAIGVSEVIVESPIHNALLALQEPGKIRLLLKALVTRGKIVAKQPWAKQLLMFKQYGPLSGGSLVHPHTQLVSLPVLPPQIKSRIEYSVTFKAAHGRCCVCLCCIDPFIKKSRTSTPGHNGAATNGIGTDDTMPKKSLLGLTGSSWKSRSLTASGPSDGLAVEAEPLGMVTGDLEDIERERVGRSRLVHLTDHFVVLVPYSSSSQYSMLVAPIRHSAHFCEATEEELDDLAQILALLSQAVYYGLDDPSYNIFIRTGPSCEGLKINNRAVPAEELRSAYHWLLEFRPRFPADLGGFEIASGIRVVTGLPEDHAAELRQWVQERLAAKVAPVRAVSHLQVPGTDVQRLPSNPRIPSLTSSTSKTFSKTSRWSKPRISVNLGPVSRPGDTAKESDSDLSARWQRNVSVP